MIRADALPFPTAPGARCTACQDTGAVIVGTEAAPCTCSAADYEWAAKLNRARVLKAERPMLRRGLHGRPDYPRSSEDRNAQ